MDPPSGLTRSQRRRRRRRLPQRNQHHHVAQDPAKPTNQRQPQPRRAPSATVTQSPARAQASANPRVLPPPDIKMNVTASGSTGPTSIAQYRGFHQAVAAEVEPGITWRPSPQFDGAVVEEDQWQTHGIHPFKGAQSPRSNFLLSKLITIRSTCRKSKRRKEEEN